MINEAVSAKLNEGPKEIGIRTVMADLKEPIVGSLAVDISQETGIEEKQVESVISRAYENMTVEIIKNLDIPSPSAQIPGTPRRRIVARGV